MDAHRRSERRLDPFPAVCERVCWLRDVNERLRQIGVAIVRVRYGLGSGKCKKRFDLVPIGGL